MIEDGLGDVGERLQSVGLEATRENRRHGVFQLQDGLRFAFLLEHALRSLVLLASFVTERVLVDLNNLLVQKLLMVSNLALHVGQLLSQHLTHENALLDGHPDQKSLLALGPVPPLDLHDCGDQQVGEFFMVELQLDKTILLLLLVALQRFNHELPLVLNVQHDALSILCVAIEPLKVDRAVVCLFFKLRAQLRRHYFADRVLSLPEFWLELRRELRDDGMLQLLLLGYKLRRLRAICQRNEMICLVPAIEDLLLQCDSLLRVIDFIEEVGRCRLLQAATLQTFIEMLALRDDLELLRPFLVSLLECFFRFLPLIAQRSQLLT